MKKNVAWLKKPGLKKGLTFLIVSFTMCLSMTAQEGKTITGKITDDAGVVMPGVNVYNITTGEGSITGIDGNYSLKASQEDSISFSFMGYVNQEIEVGTQEIINITLKEEIMEMEELVVVGYGVQKKSDVTGAIASVSGDDIVKTPNINIAQALQGRAAGVQVINASGMPGANVVVRVRGINSINESGPVYIIDGVPGDINAVNPQDIESVEVLKDASSQAIYGSSGGNGVILITTRKGALNQKVSTTFTMYRGIQSNDKNLEMANTEEFLTLWNKYLNKTERQKIDTPLYKLPDTDWWEEVTRDALIEEYNLSTTGGTENSTYMFSLGYLKQDGIVKKTDYNRYSVRLNTETKLSKRIKIGENLSLIRTTYRGDYDNASWGSMINGALNTSPVCWVRDQSDLSLDEKQERNISWEGWGTPYFGGNVANPVVSLTYEHRQKGAYRVDGNTFVNMELLKGLTYETRFGGSINFYEMDDFNPYFNVAPVLANRRISVERELNRTRGWNWQHIVNYQTSILNDHNIEIMGGFEAGESFYKSLYAMADSLMNEGATEEFQYIDASLKPTFDYRPKGSGNRTAGYAYFGRINYNYKGILLGQFSYRYDGSSKFGPANQLGSFPAFSLGFKFSELGPFQDMAFLSFGKLRYSWGKTGNDNMPDNKIYSLVQLSQQYGYVFGDPQNLYIGAALLAPGNLRLHWEEIVTHNIGLDLSFFDNRLSISTDYFDKRNVGMLVPVDLLATAGRYTDQANSGMNPYDNVGGISNKGVEFTIGHKNQVGDLRYSIDLNYTRIESKVIDLVNDSIFPSNSSFNGNYITMTCIGDAPGLFWGYQTDGLFQEDDLGMVGGRVRIINQPFKISSRGDTVLMQRNAAPGDVRFMDINGDTTLNEDDMTVIGNPNPKFVFGISGSVEYKGFDMNFFIQGSFGNDIFNSNKGGYYNSTGYNNFVKEALNAYRSPVLVGDSIVDPGNTDATQFRLVRTSDVVNNYSNSDWYVEDGSYLRLKSIQFGYTIPRALTMKAGIERFRLYIGAKNLLTVTKYSGLDPELGQSSPLVFGVDYGVYPQAKTYLAGLELTF